MPSQGKEPEECTTRRPASPQRATAIRGAALDHPPHGRRALCHRGPRPGLAHAHDADQEGRRGGTTRTKKASEVEERGLLVLAHLTFHRCTARRKQGGSRPSRRRPLRREHRWRSSAATASAGTAAPSSTSPARARSSSSASASASSTETIAGPAYEPSRTHNRSKRRRGSRSQAAQTPSGARAWPTRQMPSSCSLHEGRNRQASAAAELAHALQHLRPGQSFLALSSASESES